MSHEHSALGKLTTHQFWLLILPFIIAEPLLFFCSVKPNFEKWQKLKARMMKERINTQIENDNMFSTDDSDDEISKLKLTEKVSSERFSLQKMNRRMERMIQGPY